MARIPALDQEERISCGLCVEVRSEVFRLNGRDLAEVPNPTGAPEEKIHEAIDGCPLPRSHWERAR